MLSFFFTGADLIYDDYIFRNNTGHNITYEADKLYERFDPIVKAVEELSVKWEKNDIDDLDLRSTLRFLGWRPKTPLEHAVEYWEYDFETAHPLELISVKYFKSSNPANIERDAEYFVRDPRGFVAVIKEVEREIRQHSNSDIIKNQWVNQVCSINFKTHFLDFRDL